MTCCHSIRVFFLPRERLHFQGKKQALKFSHRFRGPRGFYKLPRRGFGRLREKPAIQLYLLAIARFSQVKLVVNSSWPQKGWVQFFDMVRRHHKQNPSRAQQNHPAHSTTQRASRHSGSAQSLLCRASCQHSAQCSDLIRSAIDCPSCNQCPQTARLNFAGTLLTALIKLRSLKSARLMT